MTLGSDYHGGIDPTGRLVERLLDDRNTATRSKSTL